MTMEKSLHSLLSAMMLFKVSDARGDRLLFDDEICDRALHVPLPFDPEFLESAAERLPIDLSYGMGPIPLDDRHPKYTKTLFLDLDETLVYTAVHYSGPGAFHFPNEEGVPLVGQLREGVIETLRALQKGTAGGDRWELIIWTAGRNWYGQSIATYLQARRVVIAHVIGKERSGRHSKKDITRMISETRPLDSMLIVDNRPEKCYPPQNTIGIRSWYGYGRFLPRHIIANLEKQELISPSPPSELLLTWPTSGPDGGEAMRQLKVVLDELHGQSITSERYARMLARQQVTANKGRLSALTVFFPPQTMYRELVPFKVDSCAVGQSNEALNVVLDKFNCLTDGEPIPAGRGESTKALNWRDEKSPSAAERVCRRLVSFRRWPQCLCGGQDAD